MLYRFKSAVAGEVLMLQAHAQDIFAILGRNLDTRGVIPTADLSQAMQKLDTAMQSSLKQTKDQLSHTHHADEDDNAEETHAEAAVPLHVRVQPFYKLLATSHQAGEDVYWGF